MRKFGIVLIVGLLLVSGIIAAMAYTSATVQSSMDFQVVNTGDAKLALIPNEDDHGEVIWTESGGAEVMVIDFGVGFQPDARYYYERLFDIVNNTEYTVDIWWGWVEGEYNANDWDWDSDVVSDLATDVPEFLGLQFYTFSGTGIMTPWEAGEKRGLGHGATYDTKPVDVQFHPLFGEELYEYEGYLVIYAEKRPTP